MFAYIQDGVNSLFRFILTAIVRVKTVTCSLDFSCYNDVNVKAGFSYLISRICRRETFTHI